MSETEGVKSSSGGCMTVLSTYRLILARGSEVVVGELEEGRRPEDPEVGRALEEWGGRTYLATEPFGQLDGGHILYALSGPAQRASRSSQDRTAPGQAGSAPKVRSRTLGLGFFITFVPVLINF